MEGHLSHEEFFTKLASLLQKIQQTGHGAVHMTQKRLSFDPTDSSTTAQKVQDDPLWDLHPPNPLPILIRASDGKTRDAGKVKNKNKVKLSTVVKPDELEGFFVRYAAICKAEFGGMKKRDRSKRKKAKKGKKEGEGVDVKG